jgi:hypothetical protein
MWCIEAGRNQDLAGTEAGPATSKNENIKSCLKN